ncbi:hypothetical protein [Streptomyces sp. NPDC052107]|uniref:hypothetical protein n=1 Tax=Streptomyces sp. NPDC052107 TaxID=3155632 RepID=UPI00342DF5DC
MGAAAARLLTSHRPLPPEAGRPRPRAARTLPLPRTTPGDPLEQPVRRQPRRRRPLDGVTRAGAFLFVPGKFRTGGKSWCWVQHDGGRYRTISIADGFGHQDELVRDSRPNAPWFRRG